MVQESNEREEQHGFLIESSLQICFEGKWLENRLRADEEWVQIPFCGRYSGTPT